MKNNEGTELCFSAFRFLSDSAFQFEFVQLVIGHHPQVVIGVFSDVGLFGGETVPFAFRE